MVNVTIYIYIYTIHYMDPISYRNTIYRICRTPQVSAVKTRSSCRKGMERDLVHLSGRKKCAHVVMQRETW